MGFTGARSGLGRSFSSRCMERTVWITRGRWLLSNALSAPSERIACAFPSWFVKMVNSAEGFSNRKPTLISLCEAQFLVMMHFKKYVLLDGICSNFVRNLHLCSRGTLPGARLLLMSLLLAPAEAGLTEGAGSGPAFRSGRVGAGSVTSSLLAHVEPPGPAALFVGERSSGILSCSRS